MEKVIFICLLLLTLSACEKNPPEYSLIKPTESDRKVLVEEFSGALCPNCPQGTQDLENLKSIYKDNLIIVTIHAGDFAFPYPESKYDFTTDAGNELLKFLGNPLGYPSSVINRVKQGQSFQSFASKWASLIANELEKPAIINLSMQLDYDQDTRFLAVKVTALPLVEITEGLNLSVLIKESSIIDPQADRAAASGVVIEYAHKDVLRMMLSAPAGDLLTIAAEAFVPYEKSYAFTLPPEDGWWRANNCEVVAFVSLASSSIEIIQAHSESVTP